MRLKIVQPIFATRYAVAIVTDSASFIGSYLVERLLRNGLFVVGVDSLTDCYPRWMKERNTASILGHERFAFVEGDLLDLDLAAIEMLVTTTPPTKKPVPRHPKLEQHGRRLPMHYHAAGTRLQPNRELYPEVGSVG